MRLVSDILESNGSSSMATVCGGSLALMDAGVPMKAPCAGIAMGLVVGEDNKKYSILTDIAGAEDHYGDMDFKVAGTRLGITALQMDIKVLGISIAMMREALAQAKTARLQILDTMEKTLSEGRTQISAFAPRLFKLKIPQDKIRDLIGPGGKKIKSIIETTISSRPAERAAMPLCRWCGTLPPARRSARLISAKLCGSRSLARSWNFSREPTDCCTSAKFRSIGFAMCAMN